ncbi:MAG: hypothetical protein ACI9P8_001877, partial [Bacteroidia bacterium]
MKGLFTAALFLLTSIGFAQQTQTIMGTVLDAETQQ